MFTLREVHFKLIIDFNGNSIAFSIRIYLELNPLLTTILVIIYKHLFIRIVSGNAKKKKMI